MSSEMLNSTRLPYGRIPSNAFSICQRLKPVFRASESVQLASTACCGFQVEQILYILAANELTINTTVGR